MGSVGTMTKLFQIRWLPLALAAGMITVPLDAQSGGLAEIGDNLSSRSALEGTCVTLVVSGDDVSDRCHNVVLNTAYKDGRAEFVFLARDLATASFSGDEETDTADGTTLRVDRVILATLQNNKPLPITLPANGTCVYSTPDFGRGKLTCIANTVRGSFSGSFVTNGKTPKTERFQ